MYGKERKQIGKVEGAKGGRRLTKKRDESEVFFDVSK